ncbi:hypothetical protein [Cellulomonas sp.]|uniref:hypothetical protein n=1 Tax=Cellulomonas sp. TaxID=40001 RepID=UPI003BAC3A67
MTQATQAEVAWAHRYDGYGRIAGTPEELESLLEPARRAFRAGGRIPEWSGVDHLRAWAFYLARADRHAGGGTLGEEWLAVLLPDLRVVVAVGRPAQVGMVVSTHYLRARDIEVLPAPHPSPQRWNTDPSVADTFVGALRDAHRIAAQ